MNWLFDNLNIEQVQWARNTSSAVVVASLVAVLVLSLFLYRKSHGLPNPVRIGLLAARLLVLSLVVLTLFEPIAVVKRTRKAKPRLPVLIDVSKSMAIKDQRKRPGDIVEAAVALGILPSSEAGDVRSAAMQLNSKQREAIAAASRLDLAGSLLADAARPVLESLGQDLDIGYYEFGTSVRMLGAGESVAADSLAGLAAGDTGTAIADSLEVVASSGSNEPLAGIVLLTDGLDTSSRRTETAIHDLGIQGVPVYPVPVGLTDPDDVSIGNIVMQEVAFSGDKVPIRVQVRSNGYEKRSAAIDVRLDGRSVARKNIKLAGGLQSEEIFFNVDVHEKGAAQVEIAVEPFADEATAENNRVERSVRIVNEKINVLCIEGSARWEYRYLRAMLKRDPRINATFIATRSGPDIARNSTEYIARFPDRRDEAFKYDLVILGDVDSNFFTGDEFLRLEELVKKRGGSLLMLCGPRYSPTSYAGTPIETMLPVRFATDDEWEDVTDNVFPVLTAEGRSSLVMTLEMDQEENDNVWSRVAPLHWLPPLLEPRPGATVLATLSDARSRVDQYPLVAWQRYGTGKCMIIGTDQLWLLRFKTGDKYHWRVWSQCIQFLTLSRLMGEHKRIRLETDRAIYPVDGQVQLYAHLLDDRFEPVVQAGFDVVVTALEAPGAEPQRVTLRPDSGRPGLYEGYFSPTRPGGYRVEANAGDRILANTTEFQVTDAEPEMVSTDMQIERLRRIADLSGGNVINMRDIHDLPPLLDREPYEVTYTTQIGLWDNGWMLFILVVLMGSEWIVRRRYDLP